MRFRAILPAALFATLLAGSAAACDLCGCYLPAGHELPAGPNAASVPYDLGAPIYRGFYSALSEQFTRFGTLRYNGEKVANPADQWLDSSNTQFVLGYNFNDRLGVQLNVPFIYRSYKRPEGFDTQRGTESGLGDISLLGRLELFQFAALKHEPAAMPDGKSCPMRAGEPDFTASAALLAGVKLPTGDASRIKEEFSEMEVEGAPESGIHGHDLALGTGSYDAIVGVQSLTRYKTLFFQADAQFTLRGDGRYSYHFANDLTWSGGPGWYMVRNSRSLLALQCVVSGESKDTDRFQGRRAEDTGMTALYVGPRVLAALGKWSGEVGLDVPTIQNNTKLQIVPDYRIRAAVSVRF